jgi:hypothetical protein
VRNNRAAFSFSDNSPICRPSQFPVGRISQGRESSMGEAGDHGVWNGCDVVGSGTLVGNGNNWKQFTGP